MTAYKYDRAVSIRSLLSDSSHQIPKMSTTALSTIIAQHGASDFAIICGNTVINVHTKIICAQSKEIETARRLGLKEIHASQNVETMVRLITYAYTKAYSVPEPTQAAAEESDSTLRTALVAHIQVCGAASCYRMETLQREASDRFISLVDANKKSLQLDDILHLTLQDRQVKSGDVHIHRKMRGLLTGQLGDKEAAERLKKVFKKSDGSEPGGSEIYDKLHKLLVGSAVVF